MKLLYATSIDLPSTRANRLQIVNMAHSFETLLGKHFIFGLARCDASFSPNVTYREMGQSASYILAWKYLMVARHEHITHIFCREERLIFFLFLFNKLFFRLKINFYYEIHHLIYMHRPWYTLLLRHLRGVVSITHAMQDVLIASGYPPQKILVAPDAVALSRFDIAVSKDEVRRKLQLPTDKKIIVYVGTIDEPWKGADLIYDAARYTTDTILFLLVGGKPHYVEAFNRNHPPRENVLLVGYKPNEEVPLYLKAADGAVLPNSGRAEISRLSTSPMKLFEYMAASVPIVASDLPSIREILSEKEAILVVPDDAHALANGVQTMIEDQEAAQERARNARMVVQHYTWDARAKAIIDFISSQSSMNP
jgi:glycosyltransferase involved in cell wall biosynthesis